MPEIFGNDIQVVCYSRNLTHLWSSYGVITYVTYEVPDPVIKLSSALFRFKIMSLSKSLTGTNRFYLLQNRHDGVWYETFVNKELVIFINPPESARGKTLVA